MNGPSRSATFSVGFVLFVATAIAIGALFWVGSGRGLFAAHVSYKMRIPSTSGLRVGAKVYLSGVPVGSVSRIEFVDDLTVNLVEVTVDVDADPKVQERIRDDSYVWLQTEGLLGDHSVHISMGTLEKERLAENGTLTYKERSFLDDLAGEEIAHSASDLLENTISVLHDINSGRGTIGQLLKNPDLYNDLEEFTSSMKSLIDNVNTITSEVNEVLAEVKSQRGTLGKLIFSEEYEHEFARAVTESSGLIEALRTVTESVAAGKGSLGRLLVDGSFHDQALAMTENLSRAAERLAALMETAQKQDSIVARLFTDPDAGDRFSALVAHLERSSESLETVLGMLERGEGTIGMALHDPSLALSLRDIFQGVQESGLVLDMVRNMEEQGREYWLRESRLTEGQRREVLRARALAAMGTAQRTEGEPVPATAKDESEK